MIDGVLDRLDVTIEHRGIGFEAGFMNFSGKFEPPVGVAFVIADARAGRFRKYLSSSARTGVHSCRVQFSDHLFVGHLVETRKEIELDHRESFEMQLWKFAFERRKKICVVLEGKFAV